MADLKELVLTTSGVNPLKCMRCGKCSGTCPSYDAMEYHPHQFVYMVEKGDIEKLMASKSIYTCLSCFACVLSCAFCFIHESRSGRAACLPDEFR